MAIRHSAAVPAGLAARPLRTFRTGQAADTYAYPGAEIARLHGHGLLHRLADGYYVVIPQDMVGRTWIPDLEAAAAGIATAIYGPDAIVVMGLSAARLHGAIPRALATAIVAVPRQHRPITLTDRQAVVRFVQRNTTELDAERIRTHLGPALATTPEQTILDLAHRPSLGDSATDVPAAVTALYAQADPERLRQLAAEQRRLAPLRRAQEWAGIDHGS
jgi:predicted transcriptional regulator of viral defense system